MGAVFGLYVVKEGFMAVMGFVMLRRGFRLDGAMWYGKVCTAVTYAVVFLLLIFPMMREEVRVSLICVQLGVALFSFVMYALLYHRIWLKSKKKA